MPTGAIVLEMPSVTQATEQQIVRFLEKARQRCEVSDRPHRRSSPRYHRTWPLEIRLPETKAASDSAAALHNASESGVAFHFNRPLEQGAHIEVKLFWYEVDLSYVPAVVRHCTPTKHGFLIGCEFETRPGS